MEEIIGGDGAMYVMGKLPDGEDDKVRTMLRLIPRLFISTLD
jgi:hypothetical protein